MSSIDKDQTGAAEEATRGRGRITEEGIAQMRSRIGQHLGNLSRRVTVTQEWIDRYALGIGDLNPLWTDASYARTTKHGGTLAPPSIVFCLGGADVGTGLPGVHSMYTGTEVEWFEQIRPGDELNAYGYLSSVDVKETRFAGRAVLQGSETVFESPGGNIVAKLRHFILRTEREGARKRGTTAKIEHARYTPQELEAIELRMFREVIRGDDPLRASDISVGDVVSEVVKGPFTATDEVAWLRAGFGGAIEGPFMYVQEHAAIWRRRHPDGVIQTKWGYYDTPEAVHWDEGLARTAGAAGVYDIGPQRFAWMLQSVTNWMGDEGRLLSASVRLQRFVVVGDVLFASGRVESTETVEGGTRVTIGLSAVNQRGEETATASAQVLLPA